MSDDEITSIQGYKNQRSGHKGKVTYFRNKLSRNEINSLAELQSALNRLRLTYDKYNSVQEEIESKCGEDQDERDKFEDDYGVVESILIERINDFQAKKEHLTSQQNTTSIPQSNINTLVPFKLPELTLPKFSGLHTDWLQFRNRFVTLINDNVSLDAVSKFQYLISSIDGGKAYQLVAELPITKDNYGIAWSLIVDHYDNEIAIQQEHMRQLYDIEKPKDNSVESLEKFITTVRVNITSLKSLQVGIEHWDLFLNHHLLHRLDSTSRNEVIRKSPVKKLLTLDEFIQILQDRVNYLKQIKSVSSSVNNSSFPKDNFPKKFVPRQYPSKSFVTSVPSKCLFCRGSHSITECSDFKSPNISPRQRFEFVKSINLCGNCLLENHRVVECKKKSCSICNLRHNVLLHFNQDNRNNNTASSSISAMKPSTSSKAHVVQNEPKTNNDIESDPAIVSASTGVKEDSASQVLLATAVIKVKGQNGNQFFCRALIDNASQSHFITSKISNMLNLKKFVVSIPISGINESMSQTNYKVNVQISSRHTDFQRNIDCLVLSKITGDLPTSTFNFDPKSLPVNVKLADPLFYESNAIDMLIGAEIFWEIMTGQQVQFVKDLPPFQETVFGFILSGRIFKNQSTSNSLSSFVCCHLEDLHAQVKKFWELEQISSPNQMSLEEKRCEEVYSQTVKREQSGRYIVSLPLKDKISELGLSSSSALRQYQSLERKFAHDSSLQSNYNQFLQEYLSMGHMELVENECIVDNIHNKTFYLPHHAVHRETSTTTKLRVVFNASSKSSSGISLNDCMMVGPTIQQDLFSIVLRFRKHKVAFVGDLAKMYRQVNLIKSDRDLLRIYWRQHSNEPIKCYRLSTVTYGTASAPFLAIRTLKQLADDEGQQFPDASTVLKRDFYVDDLLTGAESIECAMKLKSDLVNLLNLGCFELRKIESNVPDLSDTIETSKDNNHKSAVSILGIDWNQNTDQFEIKFKKLNISATLITKSTLLSEIMQLYDPMGFCAPMILTGKLIVQIIFGNKKLDWNDEIPSSFIKEWESFKVELSKIEKFVVPRCVFSSSNILSIELHGFGDASEKAYGCSIYVRVVEKDGTCKVHLLCAKSRVAPLKRSTIPRLELCASLLLAQLMSKTLLAMEHPFNEVYYWSDSEITIYRIKSVPSNYATFVANRVSQIQDLSSPDRWFYVPSEMNPADLVSRGLTPQELLNSRLWWNGPLFLCMDKNNWPKTKISRAERIDSELRKSNEISLPAVKSDLKNAKVDAFCKYSNFNRLVRIAALCLRLRHREHVALHKEPNKIVPITPSEIRNAIKGYIRYHQSIVYAKEIKLLKKGKACPSKSPIRSLSPFLDSELLLRVGGRLENANVDNDKKHPILMSSSFHFSRLIAEYEHRNNLHCGPQSLMYHIRQKYWITNCRNLCRSVVHQCIICFKNRPRAINQVMGHLPKNRVTPCTPFQVVGVDFCGPFYTASSPRAKTQIKAYLAIFVCFAVKGVHIEVVKDLSTNSFLDALRRFIGRRGLCTHIYSDNATNFVGAKSELIEFTRIYNSELFQHEVQRFCTTQGIEWHTIPPRSPHFGGLWEAAVKSAKHHIKRVVGLSTLTSDQLHTLTVQVEACLNSRPLTSLSNDPSDLRALTPAHFWRGSPLNVLPEPNLDHLDFNRLSLYQRIQHQFQLFWRRWSVEFLTELQQKKKWFKENPDIKVGSLVLLKEDNTPPLRWNLARVVEIFKGSDGHVRVVTVKTANSLFKRAITRVCPLPIEIEEPLVPE